MVVDSVKGRTLVLFNKMATHWITTQVTSTDLKLFIYWSSQAVLVFGYVGDYGEQYLGIRQSIDCLKPSIWDIVEHW